jgi:hypothetical protein
MAAAILTQGLTAVVTAVSTLVTHVAITTDSAAFAVGQTVANPTGGGQTVLTQPATTTVVNANTINKTVTITGSTQFTGLVINSISAAKGTGTTGAGTDTLTRSVRGSGLGIGVQAGDVFTVGVQLVVTDAS